MMEACDKVHAAYDNWETFRISKHVRKVSLRHLNAEISDKIQANYFTINVRYENLKF